MLFELNDIDKNSIDLDYFNLNKKDIEKKISELDEKIQEVMKNDTSVPSSDMKLLEEQIDSKVEDIRKITDANTIF